MQVLMDLLPTAAVLLVAALAIAIVHRILKRAAVASSGDRFRHQLVMLVLVLVALILVVLVIPVSDNLRGQILSLLGIVISASIALSSTTLLGNALAGFMLRVVRSFRIGDFIETEGHFGRVSERGLFHTEIQTENRDLTTLPNLYLVTHPVNTVRSSGTIVSTTVSLGYDLPRPKVKELLLDGARSCGLEEPFVQVLSLGDFSVTYRVAGLLTEVKQLLTVRSRLRGAVMDALHGGGVEIVSPNFMNQRMLPEKKVFIPAAGRPAAPEPVAPAQEAVAFDKAEQAESLEGLRHRYRTLGDEINSLQSEIKATKEPHDREQLEGRLGRLEAQRERLAALIKEREEAVEEH